MFYPRTGGKIKLIVGTGADSAYPYHIIPQENSDPVIAFRLEGEEAQNISDQWRQNDCLILDCFAHMKSVLKVEVRFFGKNGEDKFILRDKVLPGRRLHCVFELKYLDSSRNYPGKLPGHLKSNASGKPTAIDDIAAVEIRIHPGVDFEEFTLYNIFVSDQLPDLVLRGAPIVDKFGQWKEKEWKHKIRSEEELCAYLQKEYQNALQNGAYISDEFDEYGGWKKLRFEKKGHFYRTFDGKRWWLVDPLGNAFFSNGVCYGNRTGVYGMIDSMEELFEELPPKDGAFRAAWTTAESVPEYVKRNGLESAKRIAMFNFARANMIRAFGEEHWLDAWIVINSTRMKAWGFNTISVCVNNYSDDDTPYFLKKAKMPYCITLKNFPKTQKLLYRDFPDVYSEEYNIMCRDFCNQLLPYCNDPYFIGYFITNEPEWMFQKNVNVAFEALKLECESKRALLKMLEEKYRSVAALNQAWNTSFSDFSAIGFGKTDILTDLPQKAQEDFVWLRNVIIEQFSAVPSKHLNAIAPNAVNLGMRYSLVEKDDFAGAEKFDIFSFNCYSYHPVDYFQLAENSLDMPFLIGEWHIGSRDSGLMEGALISAPTQDERGKGCADYLRLAFSCKNCVGAHYFEWNDQPVLGRFDGENMQLGLIDICNQPYEVCIKHIMEMNRRMYQILSGEETAEKIRWVPSR